MSTATASTKSGIAEHIQRVDHVAILVADMAEPLALFGDVLGASLIAGGDNDITGSRIVHLAWGGFKLELVQPLRPDSPLMPRLTSHGPGFHHVTVMVDDLLRTSAELTEMGLAPVGEKLESAHWHEAFLPPKRTFGALIQLAATDRRWDVPTTTYTVADVLAGRVEWRDYVDCLR